jgi:hypothetical protein
MNLNAEDIKRQATGRWVQILQSVCRLTDDQLNPRVHGPCPQCGGTDRFRALPDVAENGGLFCNKCFSKRNGDGFAAIQWLNGCTFAGALKRVSEFLGNHSSQANGHHKTHPPKEPANPKTVHATPEKAADALAWAMVKSGIIPEQRKPDSGWQYHNADGSDAGAVLRWNLADDRKEIRQVSCVPGGWITSAMPEPRPLFRLPKIIEASEVWICEGEKSADAMVLLGLQATTSAGGSNAAKKSDWTPLDGKTVYIVPDADESGERYAREVVELIRKQAPNATVQVKRLRDDWPEIPDGGDVFDWQEQFDSADAETLRARLSDLPDRCGEYVANDKEDSLNESSQRIDFEIIDSATFATTNYRTEFLIDGVMVVGQSELIGGASKTLKTTILVEKCLSLAAAVPFLGTYDVPKSKRCLLLSSESGTSTLQETARRICHTKGINLAALGDQLFWGFRPPMLTDSEHIAALKKFVIKNKIDVVAIDPAYLSMNLQGNEAANQFAVGAVLMNLTNLQADTGVTPILATHFRMHMLPGVMPSLEHIAGAGFGQWARQWLLLNRREPFSEESPGDHKLLMTYGGSAGHCGGVALDVQEGRIQDGRFWQVSVSNLSEIREQRKAASDNKKRTQEQVTRENHRVAILKATKRFPKGESKTTIRNASNLNPKYFEPVWQDLISSQEIEPCQFDRGEFKKDETVRTYAGFRIVDPASRGTRTHKNTEEHTRTVFQCSSAETDEDT